MKYTLQNAKIDFAINKPKRIISLVPSITQYLFDLGLSENIVGLTLFCENLNNAERIGGTKKLDIEKIKSLNPDLILANKEENVKEQIESLAEDFPVWVSDIETLDDACQMMKEIGVMTGKTDRAEQMVSEIRQQFSELKGYNAKPGIAYFIWKEPMMVAAGNTFIDTMIREAGFKNVFAERERYPEVSVGEVQQKNPEILLLSSEPFPFSEKHKAEFEKIFPRSKVVLCDGKMFSWYGSQLLQSPSYFIDLHKEIEVL